MENLNPSTPPSGKCVELNALKLNKQWQAKIPFKLLNKALSFQLVLKPLFIFFFLSKGAKEVLMQQTFLQHNLKDLLL